SSSGTTDCIVSRAPAPRTLKTKRRPMRPPDASRLLRRRLLTFESAASLFFQRVPCRRAQCDRSHELRKSSEALLLRVFFEHQFFLRCEANVDLLGSAARRDGRPLATFEYGRDRGLRTEQRLFDTLLRCSAIRHDQRHFQRAPGESKALRGTNDVAVRQSDF